jgi:cytochrome d ubiquinol oxidase subunit I
MEAHWNSDEPADFVLFALPNKEQNGNDYEVKLPIEGLASYVITHDFEGKFQGLNDFKPEDRPPVAPVFFAFRVMVGLGLLMILIGFVGAYFWMRGTLFQSRAYMGLVQYSWPLGFVAILAGWWVTETGRQPWLATGILRTADAVSPAITASAVLTTLILFVVVYSVVFSMGVYYINRLIDKGPKGAAEKPPIGQPSRPLSAAEEATREAIIGAP